MWKAFYLKIRPESSVATIIPTPRRPYTSFWSQTEVARALDADGRSVHEWP